MKTDFESILEHNILQKIRSVQREGTTGMSIECLRQNVKTPWSGADGAPKGTNAPWLYAQMFERVCKGNRIIAKFLI